MEYISLPTTIEVQPSSADQHKADIIVSPCYPGYGTTLGNALRRVLLSSLPGAAITAIKIKGVDHEFSAMEHVKEDAVEIILNMKTIRLRLHSDEPVEITLEASGEKVVTAADFKKNSQVEIVNPDVVIATLTDKAAKIQIRAVVQHGRGYVPVESREGENLEVGYIAIDSIYTPVRNVNYKTEHVRVGQMTNYDKLILTITTDGTMSPANAFQSSAQILVEQFQSLLQQPPVTDEQSVEQEPSTPQESETDK